MLYRGWKLALVIPTLAVMAACGGSGATGTPDAGPNCSAGQTDCSGTCIDTQTDDANCGACGTVCGTGTACTAGECVATCGDGVKAESEACDDGNTTSEDGCSATCQIETGWSCQGSPSTCTTGCGDEIIAGMEVCDDGNTASDDGCSAACAIEEGWSCDGEPSVCETTCGDGVTAGTETCDDANTTSDDGCSATCAEEPGYNCTGEPSACATECGDGVIAGDEACDDNNAQAGDGCSDICQVEVGWTCSGTTSTCTTTCGDGVMAGSETCDDNNTVAADGCSDVCAVETGFTCTGTPSVCSTTCGDGIMGGAETCDDSNATAGDGCSDTCLVETGYNCSGEPSVCATTCGDGVTGGAEICDDSNTTAGDGCSDTCLVEDGYACTGAPSTCATVCGDGTVYGTETCDDGNNALGDGCSDTCQVESGYTCTMSSPTVCSTTCGDGIVVGMETCDDLGTANGDGCSDVCTVEAGYTCSGAPSACAPRITCPTGSTLFAFEATDLPQSFADNATISSVIAVNAPGLVTKVGVGLSATHTWAADLEISLVAPGGTVELSTDNGGSSDNYIDTWFSPDATTLITDGSAPFTGEYLPEGDLTTLNLTAASGNWSLAVGDDGSGDTGTLDQFMLLMCVNNAIEGGAFCGDSVDNDGDTLIDCADPDCANAAACDVCGDGVVGVSEACDDNNTTSGDGCSATCTPEPGYSCTGTPSACTAKLTCPAGSTLYTYAANDLPVTVPDQGMGQSNIAVTAPGIVTRVAVGLTIDHSYDGDLDISLAAPNGTVELSTDNGGSSDDYIGTWFLDSAATAITAGSAPFTGEFQPEAPLSSLAGMSAAGGWQLVAVDDSGGSAGEIQEYTLLVCTCTNCEFGDACLDTVDNDGNGQTDCADSACTSYPGCVQSVCGDGIVEGLEQCDDSNTAPNDGCSSTCEFEFIPEAEPNADSATATVTYPNAFITGAIPTSGDQDYFSFTLTAPADVEIATFAGTDPASCMGDTHVYLYGSDGTTLLVDDDDDGEGACSLIHPFTDAAVRQLQPGTYYIRMSEHGDNGTVSAYTLRIRLLSTCGNSAVEGYEECDGTAGCDALCARVPVCGDGFVDAPEACDDGNTSNNDGCSSTCAFEVVTETEPNGDAMTATSAQLGMNYAAAIDVTAEVDYYSFTLTAPADIEIETWEGGTPGACPTIDTIVTLYGTDGTTVLVSDDSAGLGACSKIYPSADPEVRQLPAGTYYVKVNEDGNNATIAGYTLRITAVTTCGDNVAEGYEACDGTVGCSATCVRTPVCGDGFVDGTETCDDGNTTAGDGCDAMCAVETTLEVEANNTPSEADAAPVQITGSTMLSGSITDASDEKDYFKLTVAAPSVVRFETYGPTPFACPSTSFATVIRLFDATGTNQLYTDSSGGISSCSALVANLAAGTYYVQVEESGTNASLATYHLEVRFEADAGTEVEPNDSLAQSNALSGKSLFVFGNRAVKTDEDWYAITLAQQSSIRAELIEGGAVTCESGNLDSELAIFDAAGNQLTSDTTDGRGDCSKLDGTGGTGMDSSLRMLPAGTYYLRVRASSSASSTTGVFDYRVAVTVRK